MKKVTILLLCVALIVACAKIDVKQEAANAEEAIRGFYSAVEKFDYEALPTFCTEGFTIFEEGFPFNNVEGFISVLKSMEGVTPKIKLNFVKTEILGNVAHSVVEFDGTFTNGKVVICFKTYENYILKKVDNKWLLHYFHSTHLPDPKDKDYSSIHLMKISEELPLNVLEDAIGKFNEAISIIGYTDCGYKLLPIVSEHGEYNYFMEGTWKNKETYDIIHEHEVFKSVSNEIPESINEYLKDQIYVKVAMSE